MSSRQRIWLLVLASSLLAHAMARYLAVGAWLLNREALAFAFLAPVAQIAALELCRRLFWRRSW